MWGLWKSYGNFSRKAIFTCASVWSRTRFEWEIILSDEPQKILQELENLLKKDEIKRLFCAEYKEICKECDYRYICGGHCLASEEPYDYRCIFLKAVLNYVLFYYDSKANRRKKFRNLY